MRTLCAAILALSSLAPATALAETRYETHHEVRHRHHTVYRGRHHIRKTVKRVGVGAAGGAAIGALAAGPHGAVIGAVAGGAAGALYDHHEKEKGK